MCEVQTCYNQWLPQNALPNNGDPLNSRLWELLKDAETQADCCLPLLLLAVKLQRKWVPPQLALAVVARYLVTFNLLKLCFPKRPQLWQPSTLHKLRSVGGGTRAVCWNSPTWTQERSEWKMVGNASLRRLCLQEAVNDRSKTGKMTIQLEEGIVGISKTHCFSRPIAIKA